MPWRVNLDPHRSDWLLWSFISDVAVRLPPQVASPPDRRPQGSPHAVQIDPARPPAAGVMGISIRQSGLFPALHRTMLSPSAPLRKASAVIRLDHPAISCKPDSPGPSARSAMSSCPRGRSLRMRTKSRSAFAPFVSRTSGPVRPCRRGDDEVHRRGQDFRRSASARCSRRNRPRLVRLRAAASADGFSNT